MHLKTDRVRLLCLLMLAFCTFSLTGFAQNTSGSITGVVRDVSGAVIPGAQVSLINQEQGVTTQQIITNEAGNYVFSALPAANYTVTVELPGFKTYKKTDIKLFVNDKMGLPPIVLEVGSQTESVTVEAESVTLETVSAERSGVVTGRQILDIALNGRDFTRLLKTVPGAPADAVSGSTTFNGQRANQNNFTVDGQTVTDSGVNQQFAYRISMDAIAEFKVSTTSQSAEFGRNSGAQVQVASKSGGQEFHGGGYWFKRHEGWNANSFTNNRTCLPGPVTVPCTTTPRQIYRFLTTGYNVGGPIQKNKAFFFFSHEWGRSKTPPAPRRIIVPTAAERAGDFSKTVDTAGVAVTIKDPVTGQNFPGNIIPPNRITPLGAQVLKWLPLPNVSGQLAYNYESQVASELPSFDQLYRVDYNINSKNRAYVRIINSKQTQNNPYGRADSANNLALNPLIAPTFGWSVSGNLATIISPTLTNEFQFGKAKNGIPGDAPPADSIYYRKNAGITIPLLFPNADPSGLIPNFSFAPATNRVTTFAGLPYYNANPITNVTDNLSKVLGAHTLKFGGFVEYAIKHESPFRPYNGEILFDRDTANPGETGWPFANALLGNYTQYLQFSKLLIEDAPYWNYEFFAQDSWKASRKLTLNYGMRLNFVPPLYEKNDLFTNFDDAAYDPAKKVVLYQPTLVNGARAARNPITGATFPAVLIGAIVPGVGDPANGIVHAGKNGTPRGLINNNGVQWGPRLGLAYAMNGKSVLRAGGGVFYERIATSAVGYTTNFLTNPPDVQLSQIYYGKLDEIGSSAGALFPLQITQLAKDGHVPTTYNFNLGIQRELPAKVLLDVSYVGTQSRHLIEFSPFNALPFGSAWLPQNQDPTRLPVNLDGSQALPPNLYRPYPGYAGGRITVGQSAQAKYAFGGSSNYNALQVSVNRRPGNGLQLGFNYTYSRALGTTDAHLTNTRGVNYGLLGLDRSHGLTFNYVYDIPSLAKKAAFLDNPVGRQIFGGWEISGLSSFSVGAPLTPSYTLNTASGTALNKLITGSEDFSPRVVLTCDPNKSRGDRTTLTYINVNCFAPAQKGSIGNDSGINTVRGPGLNNWDMSMFKKIQYGEGGRYIQLRVEAYNVFNHTNWTTLNTAAQFNSAGVLQNPAISPTGQINLNGFGALTAVRAAGQPGSPRIIQLAGKLYF